MNMTRMIRTALALCLLGATATLCGCSGSSGTATPQVQAVAAPTFTPVAGTYALDQAVTFSCSTAGTTIYYTTDGSPPTTLSSVYSAPIPVAGNGTTMTINAMAVKSGMTNSSVSSATYTINTAAQTAATPSFTPIAGTYTSDQAVTISTSTAGATIYYTTNGSTPTTSSSVYSAPISVAGNGTTITITAIAVKTGMNNSAAASATYTINTAVQAVATPIFTPGAGTYSSDQAVTISTSTAGATIYYTTNGSAPTASSSVYSAPIPVAGNGTTMTISAIAVKAGMTDSAVASATYTINTSSSVIFSYTPASSGALIQSSWVTPTGSDQDMYVYKDFTLGSTQSIREIDWRGGYIHNAPYGHATDFTITIYPSITGGSQPLVNRPDTSDNTYLVKYSVGGNAGETQFGMVGGTMLYDYKFVLPTPFAATGGTKYWLRIEASQVTNPDWGIAAATGGNGRYYLFITGVAQFSFGTAGDTAFTLLK